LMWRRREIENYFCTESVLLAYARHDPADDLFGLAEQGKRVNAMREAMAEVANALRTLGRPNPWSPDIKATDEFLDPVFKSFFRKLNLPLNLRKSDYHVLAGLLPREQIDPDIVEKLDAILAVAKRATPRRD